MSYKALLALGLCAGFALPAMAQQASTSPPAGTPAPGQQQSASKSPSGATIQTQLTQDLDKAGFTHVEVMPESFLVRAQDKEGRPVIMVINPDSVTSLTALNQATGDKPGAPASAGSAKK